MNTEKLQTCLICICEGTAFLIDSLHNILKSEKRTKSEDQHSQTNAVSAQYALNADCEKETLEQKGIMETMALSCEFDGNESES